MKKIACLIIILASLFAKANEESTSVISDQEFIHQQKIENCIVKYVAEQKRSYTRAAQDNLYDLINNFDRILSKLRGQKVDRDSTTREEKLNSLAKMQCEALSKMDAL